MSTTEELQEAIDGWLEYIAAEEDWNHSGVRIARRVVEALRREQHEGIAYCPCCLKPLHGAH